jgi:hypothetical protein
MRIRLLHVTGSFHGLDTVQDGQIVEVDEFNALRYIKNGIAEPVGDEHAEESAVLTPKVEAATVKRRGRPKKRPAEWHDEHAPGWSEVKQQQ